MDKSYSELKEKELTCPYCKTQLFFDDHDEELYGIKHEWWICPHCNTNAYITIRNGEATSIDFQKSETPCFCTNHEPIKDCHICDLEWGCTNCYDENKNQQKYKLSSKIMKCKHYLNGTCFCGDQETIDDCPNHLPYGDCKLAEGEDEFDYIDSLIENNED